MTTSYLAAAIQMHSGLDKAQNLDTATRLATQAAEQGAKLIVLPEFFNCLGPMAEMVVAAEPIPGPTSQTLAALAKQLGVYLVAGSLCERSEIEGRGHNTSLLFDAQGRELARYRKQHLFDVDLPGQVTFCESQWIEAGNQTVCTETSLGTIGQATCYDLRFPELFRELVDQGMQLLAFPSAFAAATGRAHWEILLRARAIENQVYVLAANQFGAHSSNLTTHGHSMIVDPWGRILAELPEGEGVVLAEIDLKQQETVRRELPALVHRRKPSE